jgi:hypothetical protein
METKKYISFEVLAASTRLPQKYLKDLIAAGKIPYLDVNGRMRFNPAQVQAALDKLAAMGDTSNEL